MLDLTRHPRLLRALSYVDRARNLFRRRQGGEEAERQLSAFYRRVWYEAADRLGATVTDFGNDVLEIRLGDRWTRVSQNCSAIDDLASYRVARTKPVMYRLLSAQGLPVPAHVAFSVADMQPAVAFLESKDRPCVVKPACGTGGGLAVTTGVRNRWQLARAAWNAAVHGDHPLIEEQIDGTNYRLLFLDGELLDAVKREPPRVVADGSSTVGQLIERANQERLAGQSTRSHSQLSVDLDLQATLAQQGLSLQSVPAAGTAVQLKTVINENSARENVTATDELCPALVAEAAQAARVSGLRLAGVDVITAAPDLSLRAGGGVFLEVNSPPGYFWHYHKRDGSFPVAVHVLEALFHRPTDRPSLEPNLTQQET